MKPRGDVTKEVRAVVKCLQAFMLREAMIARNSYAQFRDGQPLWNDDVWRAGSYESFKTYDAARRSIRALVKACPALKPRSHAD